MSKKLQSIEGHYNESYKVFDLMDIVLPPKLFFHTFKIMVMTFWAPTEEIQTEKAQFKK